MKVVAFHACVLCVLASGGDMRAQSVRVLSSDLGIRMICKDRDPSTLEDPVERFFKSRGFRVLNVGRIQRQHGHGSPIEVSVVGLDEKRRTVDFTTIPFPKDQARLQGRYSVTFKTPPPTQHASEIEDALLNFLSSELRCEVRQVTHGENAAEAADLYNGEFARIENMFREADKLGGQSVSEGFRRPRAA
jgi:hypothetical protein